MYFVLDTEGACRGASLLDSRDSRVGLVPPSSGVCGLEELPYPESCVSACFKFEPLDGAVSFRVEDRLVGIVFDREKDGISVRRSRSLSGTTEEPLADRCASRLPRGARSSTWTRRLAGDELWVGIGGGRTLDSSMSARLPLDDVGRLSLSLPLLLERSSPCQ